MSDSAVDVAENSSEDKFTAEIPENEELLDSALGEVSGVEDADALNLLDQDEPSEQIEDPVRERGLCTF